eukprot:c16728_g1_i1.p1 GENE.c16728_g1_i1~~c16728_g1_i1.p1  ORF type:complete len:295 (-),score=60.80 c16728_g1_i1:96-980(-)
MTEAASGGAPMHVELKNKGNALFAQQKFRPAIEAYTEAICMSPNAVYFTNRALCYLKLSDFDKVTEDCDAALRLDTNSVKANYFKGLALREQKSLSKALVSMERALDICNMQRGSPTVNPSFVNDIRQTIKETKRARADLKLEGKIAYFSEMRSNLSNLMTEHLDNAKQLILADPSRSPEEKESQCQVLQTEYNDRVALWESFFEKISPTRTTSLDVPDFLCCKISMDICSDPAVGPSGITYDRGVIEEYLRMGHNQDPVTRNPLTIDQLYPNVALRAAIDSYYDSNPWADEIS